jgi:exopolysaccharide biosynthesis protein
LNRVIPNGARIYSYEQTDPPIRAWYVSVDHTDPRLSPRIVIAQDSTHRASTAVIAGDEGACIAVNGGYFTMNETPARHVGLLWLADTLHSPATNIDGRPGVDRPARAAIGLTRDGRAEISWGGEDEGALFQYRNGEAAPWTVTSAMGAGPMILRDGEIAVKATEEGFAQTSIPAVHPRTAAGVTADDRLILMVVDGRQDMSRGVDLVELADLMRSAGAVDALNLDGGGSSTLVVASHLLNRPTGGTFQRSVMSAIVIGCD